jgi:outer membrane protein assembly factor BamB
LWEARIPGGRYFAMNGRQGSTKGWYTTNMAAADGRVYAGTSGDLDVCLDATTGDVLWQRKLGPTSGRIVVDGVLVRANRHLVGYDAENGRTLWTVKDAGDSSALPLRWEHDDRSYILVGNGNGDIRCVRPSDGKVLWHQEQVGKNDLTMSVGGEYLLCNGSMKRKGSGVLACYRIRPDGAERLWTADADKVHYRPKAAPATIAGDYAYIRNRKPDEMTVVELATGKLVAHLPLHLGASGYIQWMDGRATLQPDASHSKTPLYWFDVSDPTQARRLGELWHAPHQTTSSYYPILMSHPMADGRIFIRGGRGVFCYDLRKPAGD